MWGVGIAAILRLQDEQFLPFISFLRGWTCDFAGRQCGRVCTGCSSGTREPGWGAGCCRRLCTPLVSKAKRPEAWLSSRFTAAAQVHILVSPFGSVWRPLWPSHVMSTSSKRSWPSCTRRGVAWLWPPLDVAGLVTASRIHTEATGGGGGPCGSGPHLEDDLRSRIQPLSGFPAPLWACFSSP